jgi:hypothetical protein
VVGGGGGGPAQTRRLGAPNNMGLYVLHHCAPVGILSGRRGYELSERKGHSSADV